MIEEVISMTNILKKQIKLVEKKEAKFMNKSENEFFKTKISPILNKIEDKIPDKLEETLNKAFYKGFQMVFEKGTKYIEKTYNKQRIELEHEVNNLMLERSLSKCNFKNMDRQVNMCKLKNASISVVEGGALGVLGIGIPDIPIFISVIIKTIYEIALNYGFDYNSKKEKYYILLLICAAMTTGSQQKRYNQQIELVEKSLRDDIEIEVDLKEQMKITSQVLSNKLLVAKFIQGVTILGVFGSVLNYSVINKIGEFAGYKYKKRYLVGLQKTQP